MSSWLQGNSVAKPETGFSTVLVPCAFKHLAKSAVLKIEPSMVQNV